MTSKRINEINSLWMNTDVFRWLLYMSKGQVEKAKKIEDKQDTFKSKIDFINNELSDKILETLQKELSNSEVKEYLRWFEKNYVDILETMIAYDNSILDLDMYY